MKLILEIEPANLVKNGFIVKAYGVPGDDNYAQVAFTDVGKKIPKVMEKIGGWIEEYIKTH